MENEEDIPINLIQEENNNKKIKVQFDYFQKSETYECNENEKIKDLLSKFINDNEIDGDLKDAYLLYKAKQIKDLNQTFNQVIKANEEDIIVLLVNFNLISMTTNKSIENDVQRVIEGQRESLLFQNIERQPAENSINICNIYNKFKCILNKFRLIFCCFGGCFLYGDLDDLYFIKINRTLFYQSFIIGIVNYIDYHHNWNEIYIESSKKIKIILLIVSLIVVFLILGIIVWIYYASEKIKKIILYIYHFLYIPIIIIYCFLLASKIKKDYILCITIIIITINLASVISSFLFFLCGEDCYIFTFFIILDSLFSILNLYFTFKYWDKVNEGKILIIIITIAYNFYILFGMGFSYVHFKKEGYEIGILIINYMILFPIALLICIIILISFLF